MMKPSASELFRCTLPLLIVAIVAGCDSSSPTTDSAPADSQTSNALTSSSTSTQTAEGDGLPAPQRKPPAGKGNAIGRVLFNGKGAPDIEVQLCENIGLVGGCGGKSFSSKTNKDGFYIIDNVTPGDYSLAVRVFNTNSFIYPTTGILSAAKFKVEKDKSLDVRAVNIWKTDVQTTSPKNGETVKTGQPKFAWKAYPDAASYKVTVRSKGGVDTSANMETSEPSATSEKPLLNGDYEWKVEAFNGEGVKLAETAKDSHFKVVGQAGSNTVEIINPRNNASISGANVTLQWKAHPQATEYRVYLKGVKDKEARLSFETVNGTSYKVEGTLPPDTYFLSVNAHNGADKVAGSPFQQFKVK